MVVFARPRHAYTSYTDFWRLVELSGYSQCYADEIDLGADEIYITAPFNGDFVEAMRHRRNSQRSPQRATLVLWYLERPEPSDASLNSVIRQMASTSLEYVDHIWVSDRHLASLDDRLTFVVLGGHPGLRESECIRGPCEYDYAVMSYINFRRLRILRKLEGLRLAPNAWGVDRSLALSRTTLMLNIHQTRAPIIEPLRFALSAAHGVVLVSEECADPFPFVPDREFIMCGYEELNQVTRDALNNPQISALGENLRKKLTLEWTFRRGVEDALKALLPGGRAERAP